MSTALAVYHGDFGRASIYRLNRPLAMHAHREGHLIFYLGGTSSGVQIGESACELSLRKAVAINPWQPHSFHPGDPTNGSLFLTLYIKPVWFLEAGRSARTALRFGREVIEVTGQVEKLVRVLSTMLLDDEQNALFEGYLYELTRECFEQSWQWISEDDQETAYWRSVNDYRIRNSIKLMKERLGDELALDGIARDAGLSRPHFYKLFRQKVGITPNVYLNTLKMEVSIDRLTTTGESVTEIGLDLGFSSQASFTRFFTSNVGIPPTDYRRATLLHNPA